MRSKLLLYSLASKRLFSEGLMQIAHHCPHHEQQPMALLSLRMMVQCEMFVQEMSPCSMGSIKHRASTAVRNASPISNKHSG